MTQSLSGSGQTFCSLRGLSGPPPSAVCAPEMEAEMEVYGRRGGVGSLRGGDRDFYRKVNNGNERRNRKRREQVIVKNCRMALMQEG